jgi:hypothetical protein
VNKLEPEKEMEKEIDSLPLSLSPYIHTHIYTLIEAQYR